MWMDTARKRTRTIIRFKSLENWKMFLNGDALVALDTERALVARHLWRAWRVGTWCSSRKAELSGVIGLPLDRHRGTAYSKKECPKRGKPYKN